MNKSGKSSPKGSKRSKKSSSPSPPQSPGPEIDPAYLCPQHNKELTLFNESTEQPLCPVCVSELGPGPHKISNLEEAYRYRQAAVHNMLTTHLFNKKEQLLARMHRTEYRLEELKRVELLTMRDTKGEFGAILDRLNASCNLKEAMLVNELTELQNDLGRIDYINSAIEAGPADVTLFLSQFPKLKNAAEFAASKPFKTLIEVTPEDLPNELAKLSECVDDQEAFTHLTAFKDEVLWRLLHERTGSGTIREEAKRELTQWVELTNKLVAELEKLQLVCEYCGEALTVESANRTCGKNTGYTLANREIQGKDSSRGTGRHRFSKPKPLPPSQPSQIPHNFPTSGSLLSPEDVIANMRLAIRARPIDVESLFRNYDVLNTGTVTPTDFYQIASSAFGINGQQAALLMERYDAKGSGRVDYRAFSSELMAEYYGFIERAKERLRTLREEFNIADGRHVGKVHNDLFSGVLRKCGFNAYDINFALRLAEVTSENDVLYPQLLSKLSN